MITIEKLHKNINGIDVVLLKKTTDNDLLLEEGRTVFFNKVKREIYDNISTNISNLNEKINTLNDKSNKKYNLIIDEMNSKINETNLNVDYIKSYFEDRLNTIVQPQQEFQDIDQTIPEQILNPQQNFIPQLTLQSFLSLMGNEPLDGNILSYNAQFDRLVWIQQINLEPIEENITDILTLIEDLQTQLDTHTHFAKDIYGGTFPDSEYTFQNEVRQQTSSFITSSKVEKFQIKYNSTTNTLDIVYVG